MFGSRPIDCHAADRVDGLYKGARRGGEARPAILGAKVVEMAFVLMAGAAVLRLYHHAADWVSGHSRIGARYIHGQPSKQLSTKK